ncbi:hypothetical protein [Flavobacterium beibuense]|uniref:hypothetical protein n=1 Tax=Flavobacterium beibuense TaxID=657326 RepID=UPI0006900E21|nr:hypothetical protein [Flavobacterium beibuense]
MPFFTDVLLISVSILLAFILLRYYTRQKSYKKFITQNEGKKFFCYNDRLVTKAFIETHVLPILPEEVEVVWVENRKPISLNYKRANISTMLYEINSLKGSFPFLVTIENGTVDYISLQQQTYKAIQDPGKTQWLLDVILGIFDDSDKS